MLSNLTSIHCSKVLGQVTFSHIFHLINRVQIKPLRTKATNFMSTFINFRIAEKSFFHSTSEFHWIPTLTSMVESQSKVFFNPTVHCSLPNVCVWVRIWEGSSTEGMWDVTSLQLYFTHTLTTLFSYKHLRARARHTHRDEYSCITAGKHMAYNTTRPSLGECFDLDSC